MSREDSDRVFLEDLVQKIDLSAYAVSRGYREVSSDLASVELFHAGSGDRILAGRTTASTAWHYRAVGDPTDSGRLSDFVTTREGKAPNEVLEHLYRWDVDRWREWDRRLREPRDRPALDLEEERGRQRQKINERILAGKGITRETIKAPIFRNALTSHLRERPPVEMMIATEMENQSKRFVVARSILAALSYHQLHERAETSYAVLPARTTPGQAAILEGLFKELDHRATVIAAISNDTPGHQFSNQLRQIVGRSRRDLSFEQHAPTHGRTWNEHMQLTRGRRARDLDSLLGR